MKKPTKKQTEKPLETSGKPVRPKKPMHPKVKSEKIPIPCGLTENRVREIVREEILI